MLRQDLNLNKFDNKDKSTELTEKDKLLVEKIARKITYLGLTIPAIFFIEMHKPLSFLGSQLLFFLEPLLWGFFNTDDFKRFAIILEKRDSLEFLLQTIEKFDAEIEEKKRIIKQEKKNRRK
ncbi:hypothetical protein KAU33_10645 [Candidatus Dependentiae bacterium]|nr:hypothetical protein [Candidatus Dependentiae bacterium]